jgi:hypothetical protein
VFVKGTGFNSPDTVIAKLYNSYTGTKIPIYHFSIVALPGKANAQVTENVNDAFKKVKAAWDKNNDEPIHIFGYSRGGYAAVELMKKLQAAGIKTVVFVGLLDASVAGLFKGDAISKSIIKQSLPEKFEGKIWIGVSYPSPIVHIRWDIKDNDPRLSQKVRTFFTLHLLLAKDKQAFEEIHKAAVGQKVPLKPIPKE